MSKTWMRQYMTIHDMAETGHIRNRTHPKTALQDSAPRHHLKTSPQDKKLPQRDTAEPESRRNRILPRQEQNRKQLCHETPHRKPPQEKASRPQTAPGFPAPDRSHPQARRLSSPRRHQQTTSLAFPRAERVARFGPCRKRTTPSRNAGRFPRLTGTDRSPLRLKACREWIRRSSPRYPRTRRYRTNGTPHTPHRPRRSAHG